MALFKNNSTASFDSSCDSDSSVSPSYTRTACGATAPKGFTFTDEGALADRTQSPCLKFFSTVMARDKTSAMPDDNIRQCLSEAWAENPQLTLRLVAHLRDCREGKGERHASKVCWQWLVDNHYEQVDENAQHLPFYGRWADLVQFFTATSFQSNALALMAHQLRLDKALYDQSLKTEDPAESRKLLGQISLCAKWAPTEKCVYDKQASKAKHTTPSLQLACMLFPQTESTPLALKQYRTEYLAPLRAALNIVESLLCAKKYEEVNFSKVPSVALKLYSAKCFPTHMAERFRTWQAEVMSGKAKANTSQVDPYEVVRLYVNGTATEEQKPTLEAFYKLQVEEFKRKYGTVGSSVCVVDVSGSMSGTPMEVAISLGIWISDMADPAWNLIYTFEETPHAVDLSSYTTLESRISAVKQASWGGTTNLQATFDLMLCKAQKERLTDAQLPKRLVIISDMQFDQACGSNCWTNLETIKAKYRLAGYTMPEIVFWNVGRSVSGAAPAPDTQAGVVMLSGYSKNLIPILINGLPIPTPYDTMVQVLSSERYNKMTYVSHPSWASEYVEPAPLDSVYLSFHALK